MSRSLPRVERSNITESRPDERSSGAGGHSSSELDSHREGRRSLHKTPSLSLSIPRRLEGLAALALVIAVLMFLGMSVRTLYQFPVADGFRWYGDETWMLLAWKNLIAHGRMIFPIALGSQLLSPPGLLLGSPWLAAILYGVPQILVMPSIDVVNVGRVVSFIVGISIISFLGWFVYRFKIRSSIAVLVIGVLATTRSFTFATHSARYDILTGFALLVFVGIVASVASGIHRSSITRDWNSNFTAFLIGCVGVILSFAISPHLEVLLPPIVLYSAWRVGVFRRSGSAILFVTGCVVAFSILVLLYIIPNHSFSIASGISADNQFGSVLNHLPFLHLFSWSAQSHQLWAKGYYVMHEAPLFAYILPSILLSELVLRFTKQEYPVTSFVTGCLFLALVVALFVQSTLPYYLIHLMPLTALAFALHLEKWSKFSWFPPIIAVVSLTLCAVIVVRWTPELGHAGQMGKRIGEANTAAIQAAIAEASRDWEPDSAKPLILAQAPAIHELLRDPRLRVMNESFIFFPLRNSSDRSVEFTDSVLAQTGVSYVLDYNKPMTPEYETAVRRGEPIFSRIGPLLDRSVDYFKDSTSEIDTLTMYQLHTSK
jgi:hypothetical protein